MKEIVIEIEDYLYERICRVNDYVNESYYMCQLDRANALQAIRDGKPLTEVIDQAIKECDT